MIYKEYFKKCVETNPIVKKIYEQGTLLKPMSDQRLDLQPLMVQQKIPLDLMKCLVIHLRELRRIQDFLEVYDMDLDFSKLYQDPSKILMPAKYLQDLDSMEKRCLNLVACQLIEG